MRIAYVSGSSYTVSNKDHNFYIKHPASSSADISAKISSSALKFICSKERIKYKLIYKLTCRVYIKGELVQEEPVQGELVQEELNQEELDQEELDREELDQEELDQRVKKEKERWKYPPHLRAAGRLEPRVG